eukprot:TRINITY_DN1401_c0_g1_i8.p1 TRINITY_DN1401_c0_g1~~TRINITY_DN1401_c0_g1_i8.p1  ORF type:complete len:401 (-),score=53.88 TRINITY_DN1401_c0_g1_i8:1796-2998(-)
MRHRSSDQKKQKEDTKTEMERLAEINETFHVSKDSPDSYQEVSAYPSILYCSDIFAQYEVMAPDGIPLRWRLVIGGKYPEQQPKVWLQQLEHSHLFATIEPDREVDVDVFLNEKWDPNMTMQELIEQVKQGISLSLRSSVSKSTLLKSSKNPILEFASKLSASFSDTQAFLIISMISIAFRVLMSFASYSGYGRIPEYGDYEVQRHWMELTINLPTNEWYVFSPRNNLTTWRLDYPPMTAYHSWLCGIVSRWLEPPSMELHTSIGYETSSHKAFMRASVMISELLILYPAIYVFVEYFYGAYTKTLKYSVYVLALCCLPFIFIDHGHFQYNCVMSGLCLWAIYFCMRGRLKTGSVFYVMALGFKQMSLYFALGFFFFILGTLARRHGVIKSNQVISNAIN